MEHEQEARDGRWKPEAQVTRRGGDPPEEAQHFHRMSGPRGGSLPYLSPPWRVREDSSKAGPPQALGCSQLANEGWQPSSEHPLEELVGSSLGGVTQSPSDEVVRSQRGQVLQIPWVMTAALCFWRGNAILFELDFLPPFIYLLFAE